MTKIPVLVHTFFYNFVVLRHTLPPSITVPLVINFISNKPPSGGYGYFLELDKVSHHAGRIIFTIIVISEII